MLALTEGDVLVRTEATLGGAGGKVGLHVVTWGKVTPPASRVTGSDPARKRRGEWVRSRIAAGAADRVVGLVARPARPREDVGIAERRDHRAGHLSFRIWGSRAGRDRAANRAHRASVLGPEILDRVGGFSHWLSGIRNFQ